MSKQQESPRHILTKDEAESVVGPYLGVLDSCFRKAWEDWEQLSPEMLASLSARARASLIYDRAVHHAKRLFAEIPEVACVQRRGFLTALIGEKVEIRFKKLDKNRKSRNIPTQFQTLYGLQYPLFGEKDTATRLTAGYQLDTLQTCITATMIVCQVGKEVLYWLTADGDGLAENIRRFDSDTPELPAPKVRAKNSRKASEQ